MEENLCRVCLQASEDEEMSSIYNTDENGTIISNKIKSCCGIKLPKESDGFPTKICSKCKIFLTIAYKLRTICQNSDAYLRRFKVKDSEIDDNEEIQLKKETEVTEKIKNFEENVDNTWLTVEPSFPEIHEEFEDEILESQDYTNAEPKQEPKQHKGQKKKTPKKAETEKPKETQTLTCEENLKMDKPDRLSRPFKKLKDSKTTVEITKEKKKQYGICPYCGDRYALSSLSLHIRRHTGEKPYKCDMCEKAFVEFHDLKRHKRMHTGERPHVCPTCGKAFAQQSKLSRHKLVHTGERPYKCDQCEKAFTQRNELNLHIRRHTGHKPYMCGICGESFITGTFLRNHQKSMSHFEEDQKDRFIKIRVTNPSRSYRNTGTRKVPSV